MAHVDQGDIPGLVMRLCDRMVEYGSRAAETTEGMETLGTQACIAMNGLLARPDAPVDLFPTVWPTLRDTTGVPPVSYPVMHNDSEAVSSPFAMKRYSHSVRSHYAPFVVSFFLRGGVAVPWHVKKTHTQQAV